MNKQRDINKEKIIKRAANMLRCIALDMIDNANSGHQGIVLGMADVAAVLWSMHLKFQRKHSNRDRFILSAGHGSALLYATLYCMNEIELNDLLGFRKIGSELAGHPEKSDLIEMTTGPLGQGIAWAVGIAKAEKLKCLNYYTYVLASDGDLMEGISYEACALAGKWNLNKLIVFWDDNEITIDGSTDLSRVEQVTLSFKSYNWNVIEIDGHNVNEINNAILQAQESDKPTLIRCKTIIGYGSNYERSEKIHGKVMKKVDIDLIKEKFSTHYNDFQIPPDVRQFWDNVIKNNTEYFTNLSNKSNNEIIKSNSRYLVDNKVKDQIKKDMSIRVASGIILNNLAEKYDDIVFGSADLGASTNTMINGRYIAFGVREHAMTAITGGMVLSGLKACCATFLVFTDYARPAIRLAALMKIPLIFIATHDSIAVGEDGPTHQPIEHLDSLRLIPNLRVFRPSNGLEVAWAWEMALNSEYPSILVLSRQKIRYIEYDACSSNNIEASYFIKKYANIKNSHELAANKYNIKIIATGSEVPLSCDVADAVGGLLRLCAMPQESIMNSYGAKTNSDNQVHLHKTQPGSKDHANIDYNIDVISMISTDLFDRFHDDQKKTILESDLLVCIEASHSNIWYKYGVYSKNILVIGISEFGLSGKGDEVMAHFGFEKDKIVAKIMNIINGII